MKHYYKFSINYEDEYAIHSVNQELKKGDVTVIPVYADEFEIQNHLLTRLTQAIEREE